MKIVAYNNYHQLEALENAWNTLGKQGLLFVPSFSELCQQLQSDKSKFCLLAAVDNLEIKAIACFIYQDGRKNYHFGAKKLFDLPARTATLFGSSIVGEVSEDIIRDFFSIILKNDDFDLIDVGYIFVDSPLYKAVKKLPGAVTWRVARKKQKWWLIRLPPSFQEYLASLRETTRMRISRDCRKFERKNPEFRIIQCSDEVEIFLRDAQTISHATYQWKLNYGLRNDEVTRQKFIRLADRGILRCYITYLQGQPCAFGWGDLSHGKFYFRQTGFDPQFRKLSPGTALIMRIIRDMIENTNCHIFHFQWGGEDGYKSRFGTEGCPCTSVHVARTKNPYSLLIALLDRVLNLAKNLIGLFVEHGPLKGLLRSTLRRSGVGTF